MLKIFTADLARVRTHGERSYPHEACGVLIGSVVHDVREVQAVVECGNERTDSPQNRYGISPKELIAAQKQARTAGLEIVGFYHSHPDFPPRWSATDLVEAHWLGCAYVITSVAHGAACDTTAFILRGSCEEDKYFEDEAVEVK